MKKLVSTPKQRWKWEIDFQYQWKKSFRLKDNIFKSIFKFHNPKQFQTQGIFRKAWKQSTSKQSKIVVEGRQQQSSWIQTILGKITIKRRVQNFKNLGKTVAATTIGDYLVNLDLWTIYSLSNRLFDNKTNMLSSSRCLDFPNGKCMYFYHWW